MGTTTSPVTGPSTEGEAPRLGLNLGMEPTQDVPGYLESPSAEATAVKPPWEWVEPTTTLEFPLISGSPSGIFWGEGVSPDCT